MDSRPHMLIVMTDQQRADCLSCAGHPQLRTPNMDRIAEEGVRFTQAATVSPLCMPARASFVNSLYPHNHGMWGNNGSMPSRDDTFFHHLQRAGYLTAYIGKSHYYPHGRGHLRDHEEYMHARGLEYVHETTGPLATQTTRSYMTDLLSQHGLYEAFKADYAERSMQRAENPFLIRPSPLPVELYLDSYVGRQAASFIESYTDVRPMCLFVGFPGPHEPWDAPGEYASMYDPAKTPHPIPWPEHNTALPDSVRGMDDFLIMNGSTPQNIAKVRANYYGKISLIDRWVGSILDACEERNMLDRMIVVFWSDHGEMLGDHRRVFKSTFHESSMRIPLMFRWPDHFPMGETRDALAETIDVYPTLLGALGLKTPDRCLGLSLLPVLEDEETHLRNAQLSEVVHRGERRICLRSRTHKYAVRPSGEGFMLYDLKKDPWEQHNMIGDGGGLEKTLRDALLRTLVAAQYSMRDSATDQLLGVG